MLFGELFVFRSLGLLVFALEVFLICRIVDGDSSRLNKLLWSAAILLLAPIGVVLYLLLGLTRAVWIRRSVFAAAAIGEVVFAAAYFSTVIPLERQIISAHSGAPATHPAPVGAGH
jgi:tryptophan-rich sensory protein